MANVAAWLQMLLEMRFALILLGTLLRNHVASQCICLAITGFGLALQLKRRPFVESVAAAKHWTSLNKQAAMALFCQVCALALGLVSTLTEASTTDTDSALGITIALGVLVAFLAPALMTIASEVVHLRELARALHDEGNARVVATDNLVERDSVE